MGTLRDLQYALQLKIEELRQRDTLIDELELELDTKDELIRRLQDELDRYRTTVSLPGPSAASAATSAQNEDKRRPKRQTVVSESFSPGPATLSMGSHRSCDKKQESERLIQTAFLKNDLLKHLSEEEIRAVTACMYRSTINQGCFVIQEGTVGDQAYVLEEGRLDVTKAGQKLLTVEPEDMFGEPALLYSCTHACSVSAQTDSRLWVIDRQSYRTALIQCGLRRLAHSVELLRSLPFLQSLPDDVIMKMSDHMKETNYTDGDCIIRQGATGDTLYIITKGQVTVTEQRPGPEEKVVLTELFERQWFGEKALWGEDIQVQTGNVVASGEVTCLLINQETFKDVIDGLACDCQQDVQKYNKSNVESGEDPALLASSTLSDFQILCTVGFGEFGHVDLVRLRSNITHFFAMRVLKKKLIVNSSQQEHIRREGRILMDVPAHCPFIVRLHKAFRDAEQLYILTEACLGGDLSALLKEKGFMEDCSARFYTACVAEALAFLHSQGVVYRDVKPENVLLDQRGYAKLIGSRCMKKVERGQRTWTLCGTLGYMAPEILLNKGHGVCADLWSLGVFVFELLSGGLPFDGSDPIKILSATIRGIDQIQFPETISKEAVGFIRRLCSNSPLERLRSQGNRAIQDIQKHKWFEGFNWDGLYKRTLIPPVVPKVENLLESTTCAFYSEDSVEPFTNWDDF
ncbi:cGMP-dependent protein kinase 1 [Menidia menidia]